MHPVTHSQITTDFEEKEQVDDTTEQAVEPISKPGSSLDEDTVSDLSRGDERKPSVPMIVVGSEGEEEQEEKHSPVLVINIDPVKEECNEETDDDDVALEQSMRKALMEDDDSFNIASEETDDIRSLSELKGIALHLTCSLGKGKQSSPPPPGYEGKRSYSLPVTPSRAPRTMVSIQSSKCMMGNLRCLYNDQY